MSSAATLIRGSWLSLTHRRKGHLISLLTCFTYCIPSVGGTMSQGELKWGWHGWNWTALQFVLSPTCIILLPARLKYMRWSAAENSPQEMHTLQLQLTYPNPTVSNVDPGCINKTDTTYQSARMRMKPKTQGDGVWLSGNRIVRGRARPAVSARYQFWCEARQNVTNLFPHWVDCRWMKVLLIL